MSLLQKPRRYGIPKSISNVNNSPDQKVKGDINIISNNNNQEIINTSLPIIPSAIENKPSKRFVDFRL